MKFNSFKRTNPKKLSIIATNFFKENFRRQGFLDSSLIKWKPKTKNRHTQTLVRSGRMRKGIRPLKATFGNIVIVSDAPYSAYQNDGTQTIPARKFIGESEALKVLLVAEIKKDLKKVFR